MRKRKKIIIVSATTIIFLFITLFQPNILNKIFIGSFGWTYLKYDNKLYVLNNLGTESPKELKALNLTKAGKVEFEIPIFFEPIFNKVSNGLPRGTEIYTNKYDIVVIKFKNKFYQFEDTATAEGWGNGMMVRLH